ncbi:MAG: MerR family transcriptional regulator [Candidatus Omnitrophica bacterium]|nr:MerR family transcriptional regulator [Candidatus Omnitrophota bacterium]
MANLSRNHKRFTITEVAGRLGVTAKTLIRWEKAGKVRPPKRDWRGWRVYSEEDVRGLRTFHESLY